MKELRKRVTAMILLLTISVSCLNVQATTVQPIQDTESEATGNETNEDVGSKSEETIPAPDEVEEKVAPTEKNETEEKATPTEKNETEEKVAPTEKSETEKLTEITGHNTEVAEPEVKEEAPLIDFVLMENTYIKTPGIQNIAIIMRGEETVIESAVLEYKNLTSQTVLSMDAAKILGGAASFELAYENESKAGIYCLDKLILRIAGKEYTISLAEAGFDMRYGVDTIIDVEPDDYIVDEAVLKEVEASVVTLDEEGNQVSSTSLADVLDQEQDGAVRATGASGTRIIMLDPGHDASHAGAQGYGYGEETLVLKIAKYCKAELEKYAKVKVYMTRIGEACPHGGRAVSAGTCNQKRVEYAQQVNASVYISFHLNASVSSAANGVGVYYPNSNYKPEIGQEGSDLAQRIYEKLHALGIATWAGGKLIRNSENGTLYPDGSLADYLGVIKNSKYAGITAVLIEHAFLSNESDVANFLNTDAKLKKLGVTDATAIAGYYGLKKSVTAPSATAITKVQSKNSKQLSITWNQVSGATGYELVRSTTETGGYSKIATLSSSATNSYADKAVSAGKKYYYKVRAYKTGNGSTAYSSYSMAASGKTVKATTVTKVQSQAGSKLLVEWKKISGAAGYQIQRSTSKNSGFTNIATIRSANTTQYKDTGIKTNTTYYYRVRSFNKDNNVTGYGNYSASLEGKAVAKTRITSIKSVASGKLEINWKKIGGANGYLVYRSTKKNGGYKKIATVKSGKTTSYTDSGLTNNTAYYYKIKVRNKVSGTTGYSSLSGAIVGTSVANTKITEIQGVGRRKLEISWKKIKGANGYQVYRSTKKNTGYQRVATVKSGNTTKYTDAGLKSNTTYYYKIKVRNKVNGTTGYSSFCSAVRYDLKG